jgi:hypothetical protein
MVYGVDGIDGSRLLSPKSHAVAFHAQGQGQGRGQGQGQGLEFDGEVFFTDCVMPQAIASVHSALRAKDKNRAGGGVGVVVKPKGKRGVILRKC